MNLSIGIVGLPNVGKSTLFNALLKKQQAFVANYPFATIEPNIGIVPVPDSRLLKLAEITKEEHKMENLPPIVPATVKFVDIAGLVKGAAQGEGLGNKFLSHIREVDVVFQVVRHFKTTDVHHVNGTPDPENDLAVINMELIFADLQTVQNSKVKTQKSKLQVKGQKEALENLEAGLNKGTLAKDIDLTKEEQEVTRDLQLLTMKPMIIVANVDEEDLSKGFGKDIVVICAKTESELSQLDQEGQIEYLEALGLKESGLERVIKKGYETLNLISFLTAGEKEVRAWTIEKGFKAVDAAGTIHTDFIKKFIKAEIVGFDDFLQNRGWKGSREAGKARFEGKDYLMKDGDVVDFKIGT
ncbi:redox-regulated ATPase YchF [Patescibacteria group bacterium]|nr:redox-regulated ATPase YchF [Patescibacteria group bacterium]